MGWRSMMTVTWTQRQHPGSTPKNSCLDPLHSLTYLCTIRKYYSTSSTSSYVCTCRHVGNSQKWHDIDGAKNGAREVDVTVCRADIFWHVDDMLSDTTFWSQNCRRRHPTNPTKLPTLIAGAFKHQLNHKVRRSKSSLFSFRVKCQECMGTT